MNNVIAYFEKPTQVQFIADDAVVLDGSTKEPVFTGGIAFGDNIICGCCGRLFKIQEIYERIEKLKTHKYYGEKYNNIMPIISYVDWQDLNWTIKGYNFVD